MAPPYENKKCKTSWHRHVYFEQWSHIKTHIQSNPILSRPDWYWYKTSDDQWKRRGEHEDDNARLIKVECWKDGPLLQLVVLQLKLFHSLPPLVNIKEEVGAPLGRCSFVVDLTLWSSGQPNTFLLVIPPVPIVPLRCENQRTVRAFHKYGTVQQ